MQKRCIAYLIVIPLKLYSFFSVFLVPTTLPFGGAKLFGNIFDFNKVKKVWIFYKSQVISLGMRLAKKQPPFHAM